MKPRLLDGCCGAGIVADGLAVHFDVVGVDSQPQPEYPYHLRVQDIILTLKWHDHAGWPMDAYWVSPPCQEHSRAKHLRNAQGGVSKYGNLLTPTLAAIRSCHKPWVVENVPGAPFDPQPGETLITLCGSSFGLGVRRHRLFLSNVPLVGLPCDHATQGRPWGVYHVPNDNIPDGGRTARDVVHGREVMGVTRPVSWQGLKEGVPPAYGEHIARQVLAHVRQGAAA